MYLGQLSDKELLSHLDLTSTDPLIRRLVDIVRNAHGGLIDDLIDEGMDLEDYTFRDSRLGDYYYAPAFIRMLRDDRDHWKEEHQILQDEAFDLRKSLKEREALTVSELIGELQNKVINAQQMQRMATRDLEKANDAREEMRKKLDMWDTMRTP